MFTIAKIDKAQSLVFGYANISVAKTTAAGAGGHEIFDLQKDAIPPEELERAGYDFVLDFRETGEMHEGHATGRLVESVVFTPDKLVAFATDPVTGTVDEEALTVLKRVFPCRWWVGFKLDSSSFSGVESGKFKMFSIAGEADREDVPVNG